MVKTRVHELARDLGVPSKALLDRAAEMGIYLKSASSTIEAPIERELRADVAGTPIEVPSEPSPSPTSPAPVAGTLVASTETDSSTRFHRVEVSRDEARGPRVNMEEVHAQREEERASKTRWIVRISGGWGGELYWTDINGGGYSSLRANAQRFQSRSDTIEHMRGRLRSDYSWDFEEDGPAKVYPATSGVVEQVWIGVDGEKNGRRKPSDGLVHGSLDGSTVTLCNQRVVDWRKRTWPPTGLIAACPACSEASNGDPGGMVHVERRS